MTDSEILQHIMFIILGAILGFLMVGYLVLK